MELCSVRANTLKELASHEFIRAWVTSVCQTETGGTDHVFSGFTHHDRSVCWWLKYMYIANRPTMPSVIVQQFHSLAVNPIKGPKLRCTIPDAMEVHICKEIGPAIHCLKNYSKNSFTISQLMDSVLSQWWIQLSQTYQEDEENKLFNYMNTQLWFFGWQPEWYIQWLFMKQSFPQSTSKT